MNLIWEIRALRVELMDCRDDIAEMIHLLRENR